MGIKCPKCHSDNPNDTVYCGKCATPLPSSEDISVSRTKTIQTPKEKLTSEKPFVGKYQILEELGRGGMGIVYKAKDTKLKRTVALKFLPSEFTHIPEVKDRFMREAQAVAALDHPNICTVYEVDEAEGKTFISMAYIEGQSLKGKIESGSIELNDVLKIAIQIAEGLEEAHKKGIIHRDIKSANIMVTEKGQAKIMDFGLAKVKGGTLLTREGTTLGTVAYMSPEQARGEEVGPGSDIWSLGAVLYEMLTGKLPFKSHHDQAVIYSILNEDPEPITSIRKDIPKNIEQIVQKALEKDKTQRYRNINELLKDLKVSPLSVVTSPPQEKSIVVLPFEDISPNRDNEYFSDGLTEEIITDLSKIHSLRVISRNSAMMFKGTRKFTKTIGRELNVQYVLEGSVRKAGNSLRITAQLIDAATDAHLWAEKYSGTLDDVFEIQEKVSYEIVNGLKLKLSPKEKEKMGEHLIQDIRTMECWLRAKQEIHHYTKESFDRAVAMIEDGLNVVGDNVLLFWGLGYINWFYVNMGIYFDAKYLDKAEEYVNKIFELDPNSYYGFQLLGLTAYKRGDVRKSIDYTKRALKIDPNNPEALDHIIWMYADVGKTEKSAELIDRLLSVDPLTPHNHWVKGLALMMEGRLEESIKSFRRCYELESENAVWSWFYAHVLYMNNEHNKANAITDMMEKETPDNFFTKFILFTKYGLMGEKEKALQMVTDGLIKFGEWDELISWILAQCYALIEEKEQALYWLEKAANRGFINYPFISEYDPFLENIRGEERFKKLMERVKHEWENFEV